MRTPTPGASWQRSPGSPGQELKQKKRPTPSRRLQPPVRAKLERRAHVISGICGGGFAARRELGQGKRLDGWRRTAWGTGGRDRGAAWPMPGSPVTTSTAKCLHVSRLMVQRLRVMKENEKYCQGKNRF